MQSGTRTTATCIIMFDEPTAAGRWLDMEFGGYGENILKILRRRQRTSRVPIGFLA